MQTTNSIRESFISFFEKKSHKQANSSSVISKDDPSLMFVNAGMNQFKDIFLGYQKPDFKRVVNSQKCLRVSGKHNDLDQVGHDTYHHTFFEMLGNWSFGDYGKEKAIEYAWEFLVKICGLEKSRIYVTVFNGNKEDNISKDEETFNLWKSYLPDDNILYFDKDDNFWEMGDTGPCGPSTEIHYDNRNISEINKISGREIVNKNHPEVIEIWNIVFINYNRSLAGKLSDLSTLYIDTGMGLERLAMIMQKKKSNYDIDIFQSIIRKITDDYKLNYGSEKKIDIALRVIADHARAAVFSISDGLIPSNNKSGYVIRRIIRRASRYAYTDLEIKEPCIFKLVDTIAKIYSTTYNEIGENLEMIKNLILSEEKMFLKTLSLGLKRINKYFTDKTNISGDQIFELYDTYGFPYDLTKDILIEKGLVPDEKNFKKALDIQKNRSRSVGKTIIGDWTVVSDMKSSGFIGYDILEMTVRIIRYRQVEKANKKIFQIVLDQTPFYPESGGQVADKGVIKNKTEKIKILDVKKENNIVVHDVDQLPEDLAKELVASVNIERRHLISINHTATHILHNVLRKNIGVHVQQKGSFLDENYLRFDFSNNDSISKDDLLDIENSVNDIIYKNYTIKIEEIDLKEAKDRGAIMLFEEKYQDKVRVVSFHDSVELCGGTHVKSTSEIGLLKIVKETSVSSGIRRIEAITSKAAFNFLNQIESSSKKITEFIKEKNFDLAVDKMIYNYSSNHKQLIEVKSSLIRHKFESKINSLSDDLIVVSELDFVNVKDLKQLGPILFNKNLDNEIILFFVKDNDKYSIMIYVPKKYQMKFQADILIKKLTKKFGGGGGGNKSIAFAGGLSRISEKIIIDFLKK